jgi:hypothetical protein
VGVHAEKFIEHMFDAHCRGLYFATVLGPGRALGGSSPCREDAVGPPTCGEAPALAPAEPAGADLHPPNPR